MMLPPPFIYTTNSTYFTHQHYHVLRDCATRTGWTDIYVRQQIWGTHPSMDRMYGFWVRSVLSTKVGGPLEKRGNVVLKGVNAWN